MKAPAQQARDSVETLTASYVSARRARLTAETNLKTAKAAFEKAEHVYKEARTQEKNAADALSKSVKEGD